MKTRTSVYSVAIALIVFVGAALCYADGMIPPVPTNPDRYADTAFYWPQWQNGTWEDTTDYIGNFDFIYTTATHANGAYTFRFDYTARNSIADWSVFKPGGLFIDIGSDQTWDLYVDSANKLTPGMVNVYQVNVPMRTSLAYRFAALLFSDDYRHEHPYALTDSIIADSIWLGTASYSGWGTPDAPGKYKLTTFVLDQLMDLGPDYTIGFTVNLANDVIYQRVTSTPIPGAMWLFGSGILGLLGLRRTRSQERT